MTAKPGHESLKPCIDLPSVGMPVRCIRWGIVVALVICVLCKPLALISISAYQQFISPHKGWHCAYAALHGGPSCSAYGKEVIAHYGCLWGALLLRNRFGDCNEAANILAAGPPGKECADGCVRGCCNGPLQVAPRAPPVSAPSTFISPCPDAGGYRKFGWFDPEYPDRIHLGHDYNAPAQTPVRAIADGLVVKVNLHAGDFGGYDPAKPGQPSKPGPMMWIRHRTSTGEYFHALYGHVKPSKSENQWVVAGDVVGTIIPMYDENGNYIPHLHLGIWQGSNSLPPQQLGYGPTRNFVDPIKFMETHQPDAFRR